LISYLTQGRAGAFRNALFEEMDLAGKAGFIYTEEILWKKVDGYFQPKHKKQTLDAK
jgi:hypothetical protein